MKPRIDVLFPFYGDIGYMKKAVESVLAQTYDNWSLKVFDDAYPDEESERFFNSLIDEEKAKHVTSRISYEKNPTTLGANGNYSKALSHADGDYFVMMGADDLMHPDFLERFAAVLEAHPLIDIYQSMVTIIDENDREYLPLADRVKRLIMPRTAGIYQGEAIARTYVSGWHYFPSIIWKTESAKAVGFHKDYSVVQDVNLGLEILQHGGVLYFDREHTTFSYRRHSQSDSSQKMLSGLRFSEEKKLFLQKQQDFETLGWPKAARAAKRHYYSRLNALTQTMKALRAADGSITRLLKHVFNMD